MSRYSKVSSDKRNHSALVTARIDTCALGTDRTVHVRVRGQLGATRVDDGGSTVAQMIVAVFRIDKDVVTAIHQVVVVRCRVTADRYRGGDVVADQAARAGRAVLVVVKHHPGRAGISRIRIHHGVVDDFLA